MQNVAIIDCKTIQAFFLELFFFLGKATFVHGFLGGIHFLFSECPHLTNIWYQRGHSPEEYRLKTKHHVYLLEAAGDNLDLYLNFNKVFGWTAVFFFKFHGQKNEKYVSFFERGRQICKMLLSLTAKLFKHSFWNYFFFWGEPHLFMVFREGFIFCFLNVLTSLTSGTRGHSPEEYRLKTKHHVYLLEAAGDNLDLYLNFNKVFGWTAVFFFKFHGQKNEKYVSFFERGRQICKMSLSLTAKLFKHSFWNYFFFWGEPHFFMVFREGFIFCFLNVLTLLTSGTREVILQRNTGSKQNIMCICWKQLEIILTFI